MKGEKLLFGQVITFDEDPRENPDKDALHHIKAGAVAIDGRGKIAWLGAQKDVPAPYNGWQKTDYGHQFIMAGFIDAHIHFPQYRILAAPGKDLLDWLNRFTFPEEVQYAKAAHASASADMFLRRIFAHGTTATLAFSTVHSESADALFAAASDKNMAMLTGKVMMDRMAPEGLLDTAETSAVESQALIDKWHKKGRLRYAITPRFAITSTDIQLRLAGDLMASNPTCLMQTHLSESVGEIETVRNLFPGAVDYTDVYDRFGLVNERSIFAHGIHLSERELARLSEADATLIHCPTSNNFLGSGLFNMASVTDTKHPIKLGLASDVGGGTSYSMLQTMGEAYKVAILNGYIMTAAEGFYLATLGNARNLGLENEIGSITAGKWADIIIIDPEATPTLASRQQVSESIEDQLFALMILGDDRAIAATYVAGDKVYERATRNAARQSD